MCKTLRRTCAEKKRIRHEEEDEEGMTIFERSGESDVGDDSLGTRRGDARRCPCGPSLDGTSRKEINERRHEDDDGQRHAAHTVVEDGSFACALDSGSRIL